VIASPRLSVGLPVYNGQTYLCEALDALLGQSFEDFELVISDNASTDATEEICRDYARNDSRIRYIRQPHNLGMAPNHNVVLQESRGKYFKWVSHDDLYGQDLFARCVEALEERPDIVLCHSDMAYIDESGNLLGRYSYALRTDSPSAPERFHSLLHTDGGDDEYGFVRTEVMRRVRPAASYHHPGRTLVAEIALHGPFHQIPELLYYRRDHPGRGDRRPTIRARCANLDPRRARHSTTRLVAEYISGYIDAIHRSPISVADRRACYGHLIRWMAARSVEQPVAWLEARFAHRRRPVQIAATQQTTAEGGHAS
jgi:glycosyltransferase involved in cell wall biosynthesis